MTVLCDAGSATDIDDSSDPQHQARLPVASCMDRSVTLLPGLRRSHRIVPANADLTARPAGCRPTGT
jgi:hypothetical protein